jgi:2-polyprenyl-3-methyl-5-hydroxy-6-metoxy-1,4-benzoquinol methylase
VIGLFRKWLDLNMALSRWADRCLPAQMTKDGNREFLDVFVDHYLHKDMKIYDVGGGKHPYLSPSDKRRLNAHVVGFDISGAELRSAPEGSYDRQIVANVCGYRGDGDGDLVICQSLLEHVPDTISALRAMTTLLKPGGILLVFVPCRNACFARLNLMLPESWKRRILFAVFPHARIDQGFKSYYDRCIPSEVLGTCEAEGMRCLEFRRYYSSSYFSFFFPAYLAWRLWTLVVFLARWGDYCETFAFAAQKSTPDYRQSGGGRK